MVVQIDHYSTNKMIRYIKKIVTFDLIIMIIKTTDGTKAPESGLAMKCEGS